MTDSHAIGPTGRAVIANVERLRAERRLSLRALSGRLAAAGRPILPSVLQTQSQGRRRVDADDLVAFAEVLGVTPAALLAPPGTAETEDHPAIRAARLLADRIAALIAAPEDAAGHAGGQLERALRRVQLEIEELLDGADNAGHPRVP